MRKKNGLLRAICILICCLMGLYVWNNYFERKGQKITSQKEEDEMISDVANTNLTKPQIYNEIELQEKLLSLSSVSEDYLFLYENREKYPVELLNAVCNNPDMLSFALGYLEPRKEMDTELNKIEKKAKIPLLMQWDKRWGYQEYGEDCIGLSGCSPTSVSMVAISLTGDDTITPNQVAKYAMDEGYYRQGIGTSWDFMTEGAKKFGIVGQEISLDKKVIIDHIENGEYIICSMRPGDFTTNGHFVVIVGEQDGKFVIFDPNSRQRSEVLWEYDRIQSQIKNLWSFSEL